MRERQQLDSAIAAVRETERELADNLGLIELGEAEGDATIVADAEAEIARLAKDVARRQVEMLLSGEADANDAYLEVHAGAGGTESQDWAQMLLRMYVRWAERSGFKVETLEFHAG
jgi:peptide chain release factor 2